jgi:formylglycine-generating enzyme required for sulfatase activity
MRKPRLTKVLTLVSGSLVVIVAVGLGIWQARHNVNTTPPPIPTVVLVLPQGTVPSLGLSVVDSTATPMVYVPAGCFYMGSGNTRALSGETAFQMCFSAGYWIDKTDVTNIAFQKFIDGGGYERQSTWWTDAGWAWLHETDIQRPHNYDGFTEPQQPRVGIMWYEADAYCRWRGARLPTEPEWEYAARGPDVPIYPWGNIFEPSKAVYAANSGGKPATVGSKPTGASWVGALDMVGNVFQWTSTIYEEDDLATPKSLGTSYYYYSYPYPATNDGRERPNVNNTRIVIRGGSWDVSDPDDLNTAFRWDAAPYDEYYRQIGVGFRCVRSS